MALIYGDTTGLFPFGIFAGSQHAGDQSRSGNDDEDNTLFGDAQTLQGTLTIFGGVADTFGGDDNLYGGDNYTAGSIENFLAGDAWEMTGTSGALVFGGADYLEGGDNFGVSSVGGRVTNLLYGDAFFMNPGTVGGDDNLENDGGLGGLFGGTNYASDGWVNNIIVGDADQMGEFSFGGDDYLEGGDNGAGGLSVVNGFVANHLHGDAQTMEGFLAFGGADTLIGGDNIGGGDVDNFLYGDAATMVGAWGGFDTLRGGNNYKTGTVDNVIYGEGASVSWDVHAAEDHIYGGTNRGSGLLENRLVGDAKEITNPTNFDISFSGGSDQLFGGDASSGANDPTRTNNYLYGDVETILQGHSIGGDDLLQGGNAKGPQAKTENWFYGDAAILGGSATGGADFVVGGDASNGGNVHNIIYGDAYEIKDFARGGDDRGITGNLVGGNLIDTGIVTNEIYGDAFVMRNNAVAGVDHLFGGNATGSAAGFITNLLVGDADTAFDFVRFANDVLIGGSIMDAAGPVEIINYLYGDAISGVAGGGGDSLSGGDNFSDYGHVTNFLYGGDAGDILSSGTNHAPGPNSSVTNYLYGQGGEDVFLVGDTILAVMGVVDTSRTFVDGGAGRNELFSSLAINSPPGPGWNFYVESVEAWSSVPQAQSLLMPTSTEAVVSYSFDSAPPTILTEVVNVADFVFKGGFGDDNFHASIYNQSVFYHVDGSPATLGSGDKDTFYIKADPSLEANAQPTYYVETIAAWAQRTAGAETPNFPILDSEIYVSYAFDADSTQVVAGLAGIEEIDISGAPVLANVPSNVVVRGDFGVTNLATSTITVNGSAGDNLVDLTGLLSSHGVTLVSNGGNDTIIGGNANTKVILSAAFSTYTQIINPDGSLTLRADPNNSFTTDNHDIIIQDPNNQGGVDLNIAPVAQNDGFTTDEDTPLSGNLLADNGNGADSDFDRDQLMIQAAIFLTAFGGTVSINANGNFTYAPTLDFFGMDSFNYTLLDGRGGQDTATATIHVLDVNDPAIISGDLSGAVTEDTVLISTGNLTVSDVDSPESFLAGPYDGSYGTLDLTESGAWEYYVYNASEAVQMLASGQQLIDEVVIQSADSTEQTISITINGMDEQKGNPNGQIVDGTRDADTITTGNGSDVVNALPGDDVVSTGQGDDFVQAGAGNDTVYGGQGSDTLYGDAGNDTLFGEEGIDTLSGGTGNDELHGGAGEDTLHGDAGDDHLFGGEAKDLLFGGDGDDVIDSGPGKDIMTGGLGSDLFVLDLDGAPDEVTDFEDGIDHIGLATGITFGDLSIQSDTEGISISFGGSVEMLLTNIIDASQITADDFLT